MAWPTRPEPPVTRMVEVVIVYIFWRRCAFVVFTKMNYEASKGRGWSK